VIAVVVILKCSVAPTFPLMLVVNPCSEASPDPLMSHCDCNVPVN
jgi:hypothetical protein